MEKKREIKFKSIITSNHQDNYLDPPVEDLFRLLENFFLLFSSDFAALIFPTLLVEFQRLNWKSAQGPRGGDMHLFTPFPPLLFYSNG